VAYDESNGDQWRFDVTNISGSDVTFGSPQPGMLDWRGATASAIAAAAPWARQPRPALARWTTREQSRTASASSPNQEADRPMQDDQRRALAVSMGLPEDTTEADLHAEALKRAEAARAETPPNDGENGDGNDSDGEGQPSEGDGDGADQPEAAVASNGRTVTIDRTVWEQTQANAAAGAEARQAQVRSERDAEVQAAIDDGRITPVSAGLERNADGSLPDGWRRQYDEHPEATKAALARLEPGRYPGTRSASGRVTTTPGGGAQKVIASVTSRNGDHEHGKVIHR
jgi:hypothetical protein